MTYSNFADVFVFLQVRKNFVYSYLKALMDERVLSKVYFGSAYFIWTGKLKPV